MVFKHFLNLFDKSTNKKRKELLFFASFCTKNTKTNKAYSAKILNFASVKSKCNKYMDDYHAENPNL